MSGARLATGIWVAAYLKRLQLAGIPAYVIAKGDTTAGAVLVKLALMDGGARAYIRRYDFASDTRIWEVLIEGPEAEVDAAVSRQRGFDSDLWVIELEDARGRHLLDEDGLA
ncbi:MAG: hypothetical protein HLUCCA05_06515 [Roseibaca calidilacus]|uniref:GTP-binding protein Era n=1 Tax=Roseibaca calidilacus TaxID=1666912 RepID=A0A0P7WH78_9RHOB|nr:DUF1491 family protein [Roseibaca calidilacus]KPP89806.1 MAG: hypothetical protein HLUCCA05_06515 [Roseibaca calidilacus]CUX80790.1 hypothetical protein Ga0058931_1343 [Roseibaca calidilacus]